MQKEIGISQEDLNNEMKKRDREEYYEDKLLELKMKSFLEDYLINHELSNYKQELDELIKEKDSLLNEKDILLKKISEIEEENNNYEDTLNDLDNQISKVEEDSKNLDSLIITQQELSNNLNIEDNLVNHIIKTFDNSFKKQIYDICSKNVREALNNNNSNKKTELKSHKKNKKENNFMVVSGEREEFVSKGESNESNETEENNKNENKINNNLNNNPMMGGFNGQYMMYPYYFMQTGKNNMNMTMPNMTNIPSNMKGNPFFYFPFPMPNMQQNNITKKK